MQRGFCNHKDKKCRIVTEWKCVDIRFPDKITREERNKRDAECRAKDWYGVCELCSYFKPEGETKTEPAAAAASPAPPQEKPPYTESKEKMHEGGAAADTDKTWDSMMDEIV